MNIALFIIIVFRRGGHSVFERYGLHLSHMDHLKSFGPKLEKRKEELIGLLRSEKNDEKLRMILINQKDRTLNWIPVSVLSRFQ